jgi:hypothetical protein
MLRESALRKNAYVYPLHSITVTCQRWMHKWVSLFRQTRARFLTERGRRIAKKITRKYRILERFLHDILNIRGSNAHRQACDMEHALSDVAENGLCKMLQSPDKCPNGKPIPICDRDQESCVTCEPTNEIPKSRRVVATAVLHTSRTQGNRSFHQRMKSCGQETP